MGYSEKIAKDLEQSTFLGGVILSNEWLAVEAVLEKGEDIWESTPPVRLFLIPCGKNNKDEKWQRVSWNADKWVFPMITRVIKDDLIMVDDRGGVFYSNLEADHAEDRILINQQFALYENFKGLKNIHGSIYVVGTLRRVMRRVTENKWEIFSSKHMEKEANTRYKEARKKGNFYDTGFTCIDGFEEKKDLYAAGAGSDVWNYTGKDWVPIDIGIFDEKIISICCAEDGFVYLGTERTGKLIRGRDDKWEEIRTPFKQSDIISIASFQNKIYLATPSILYIYDNNEIKPVEYNITSNEVPANAGFLDVASGLLLSVGNNSISIYDGQEWHILYGTSLIDTQTANELASDLIKKSLDLMDAVEEGLSKKK